MSELIHKIKLTLKKKKQKEKKKARAGILNLNTGIHCFLWISSINYILKRVLVHCILKKEKHHRPKNVSYNIEQFIEELA